MKTNAPHHWPAKSTGEPHCSSRAASSPKTLHISSLHRCQLPLDNETKPPTKLAAPSASSPSRRHSKLCLINTEKELQLRLIPPASRRRLTVSVPSYNPPKARQRSMSKRGNPSP
ncbi:hypothetical protein P3S67_022640 [Capsicum chacoense]